ncbi:cytochrome c [soil metagenome]
MKRLLAVLVLIALVLVGAVWALNFRDEDKVAADAAAPATRASDEVIARGAYLARAGNCMGCHTARGGVPYAGGRAIATPFGNVYAPNLTPDAATGLGQWSEAHFWRALHNGRSRDGRLLYPAFPYPNYTQITRVDSDALLAYLRSLPPTAQANRPHELGFPFDQQAALAVWRALYFRPAQQVVDAKRSAEWNRGAYLVEGLGHCNACHSSRNTLGAVAGPFDLGGGLIPIQNWYAPSLTDAHEAGVAQWDVQQIVDLLKTGVSAKASVSGPMTEVVAGSTQYLTDADLRAMATFLKALPQTEQRRTDPAPPVATVSVERGAKLYADQCAQCHGDQGEGAAGAYPALAGNRAVLIDPPANLVHMVLEGGFPPATAGNPRPYGMPPFGTTLNNEDIANLLSYIRSAWGNQGGAVSPVDVNRYRSTRTQ